jgi:uncharacterized protein
MIARTRSDPTDTAHLHLKHRICTEVFLVPDDGLLMLYAPLKGLVARINHSAAALLRDIMRAKSRLLSEKDEYLLEELVKFGVVNGTPGLTLAIHDNLPFLPTCVTLFLTTACNLRCVYCYANGGGDPDVKTIPLEAAEAGIRFAADNAVKRGERVFSVNFHGAGEPTVAWSLYLHLISYARSVAKEYGIRSTVTTCTNGVLTEHQAIWIAENTEYASISLDGLEDVQDALRPRPNGAGSFTSVRRTLKLFDERHFDYMVRGTVCDNGINRLPAFVEWLSEECEPDSIQFEPMLRDGRSLSSGCVAPDDVDFVNCFGKASQEAAARGRTIGFSTLSLKEARTFYCCAEVEGFTITHDGLLTACFGVCDDRHQHAGAFIFGRFNGERQSFDIDYERLACLRRRNTGRRGNLPGCDDCFCKYMCAGDCALNGLRTGRGFVAGSRCGITRAIAANLLREVLHLPVKTYLPAEIASPDTRFDDRPTNIVLSPAGHPEIFESCSFEVRESSYMRVPPPEQVKARLATKAILQTKRGRLTRALHTYDELLLKDPNCVTALINSSALLIRLNRPGTALRRARHAVDLQPHSVEALNSLGKALVVSGLIAESEAAFAAAAECDPLSHAPRFNLAWLHTASGKRDDALTTLRGLGNTDNKEDRGGAVGQSVGVRRQASDTEMFLSTKDGWQRELLRMMQSNLVEVLPGETLMCIRSMSDRVAHEQYGAVQEQLKRSGLENESPLLFHWIAGLAHTRLGARPEADESLSRALAYMPTLQMTPARIEWRLFADGWNCPVRDGAAVAVAPGEHRFAVEFINPETGSVCRRECTARIRYGEDYEIGLTGIAAKRS